MKCNCPAWKPRSQCEHVIGGLLTVKNLLNPLSFTIPMDQERRDTLLEALYREPQLPRKKRAKKAVRKGYALILQWTSGLSDVFLEKDGEKLSGYGRTKPPRELEVFSSFIYPEDKLSYLPLLTGKHPVILRKDGRETELSYGDLQEYTLRTAMDISGEKITAGRLCLKDGEPLEILPLEKHMILPSEGIIAPIKNSKGWEIWEKLLDTVYLSGFFSYNDSPEDALSQTLSSQAFSKIDFIFPSSKGDCPESLILRREGKEQLPVRPEARHRMTIIPAKKKGQFLLKAEQEVGDLLLTPSRLSRFFSIFPTLTGLRTQKRQRVMIRTFFLALSAESVKEAGAVIKKELETAEFQQGNLKKEAQKLLKDFLGVYRKKESQLSLQKGQWISFALDKEKELQLSKIPFDLFGGDIFRDLPDHLSPTVPAQELYEKLPLLYERLQESGIGLLFKGKRVVTAGYDFSFEARREGIDWFEIRPEIRCNGALLNKAAFLEILGRSGVRETDDCIQIMDSRSLRLCGAIMRIMESSEGSEKERKKKEVTMTPRLAILDWLMLRQEGVTVKLPPEDEEVLGSLVSFRKIRNKALPKGLKAELRPYQRDGYSWLSFLYEHRLGACLADDMGLGKTIQTIAMLLHEKETLGSLPAPSLCGGTSCPLSSYCGAIGEAARHRCSGARPPMREVGLT
ncbi:MAG: hypothetical protein HGA78_11785 [Nitrospirales bacterium]|nr:hypothetical protein [Nitrospirales bacterium]